MFLSRYFIRVFGEENDSEDSAKISNQKKKKKKFALNNVNVIALDTKHQSKWKESCLKVHKIWHRNG